MGVESTSLRRREFLSGLGAFACGALLGADRSRANATGRPRLFAFVPSLDRARALQDVLSDALPKLEVTAFGRFADLAAAADSERPDGVLAPKESVEATGYRSIARGVRGGSTEEPYVVLAKGSAPLEELARTAVGVVDIVGRASLPELTRRMLGVSFLPETKRVLRVNDLLPLIQLDLAPGILVAERFANELREMSRQPLRVLRPKTATLGRVSLGALGTSPDVRLTSSLREAPRALREVLGVEEWK